MTKVRQVRLGPWTVTLYALGVYDNRGSEGLGYKVCHKEHGVVLEAYSARNAVYPGMGMASDSDAAMASTISLICYTECYDLDGNRTAATWDTEDLAERASLQWPDL